MALWFDALSRHRRDPEADASDVVASAPLWPDVAVTVGHGVVPVWTLQSRHPSLGPLRGRGLTRGMAERALARRARMELPVDGRLGDSTADDP